MTPFWSGLLLGLFIGANLGALILVVFISASRRP
jgi:hypothetical protein